MGIPLVAGGEDHRIETHLIPNVLKVALGQRESVDIFGTDYPTPDGTCIRDYIHVNDLASAHAKALDHLAIGGSSVHVNLGTGVGISVKEIISAVEKVTGQTVPLVLGKRRAGDPAQLPGEPAAALGAGGG